MLYVGNAGAKDKHIALGKSAASSSPALKPLTCRWDTVNGMISRFYPQTPVTEDEFWLNFPNVFFSWNSEYELKLADVKTSLAGMHKKYIQYYHGVPVKDGELRINLNNAGRITNIFSNLIRIQPEIIVQPAVNANAAEIIALNGINISCLRGMVKHKLCLLSTTEGVKLVWVWEIPAKQPYGDWEVIIDALSGTELSRRDMRRFWVNGTGQVFIPDPKTAIESDTLLDHNDASWAIPPACYSLVDLLELDDASAGYYYLTGPYCNTEPTENRAQETTPEFIYNRQDDRFEEVNTYYHIDTYQRYIQSLGFADILNYSFPFNVNGTTEDNSWFSPFTGEITLGSGGVDDGEDADVIIHEYGHAIQWDIIPGWSGGHTEAMGEGFGDYIAGAYSLAINPAFHPHWVFTWDGHNQYWSGRMLNMPYHYPENAGGEVHDAGQLWSAGLIDVWYHVPDVEIWDMIIFQHHYYLGNSATMEDAANAILLADIEINQAAYRDIIIENFLARGFLNPAYLAPQISHTPLTDTEDTLQTVFPVYAYVYSAQPLDSASVMLHWGLQGTITNEITMQAAGSDSFQADIPGPFSNQLVNYYISAADIYQGLGFAPPAGPPEVYSFFVGPDFIPPEIVLLDTLQNTVFHYGNEQIRVTASDNIGIAEVDFYFRQENQSYQSLPMTNIAGDTFEIAAVWEDLAATDYFYYYFRAQDVSSNANETFSPVFDFQVATSAEFDGFERGLDKWMTQDSWRLQNVRIFSGASAVNDRDENGFPSAEEVIFTLAQAWDTRDLLNMHMNYWTLYFLVPQNDTGYIEIQTDQEWETVDMVTGAIPAWEERTVVLQDYLPADSLRIRFRTKTDPFLLNPTLGWYIDQISLSTEPMVGTQTATENLMTGIFKILSVTPNPGNGEFNISFNIPKDEYITISLFDVLGRETDRLAEGFYPQGEHRLKWLAETSSGVYFLCIRSEDESIAQKILLLK